MNRFRKILVPYDFSECSRHALATAVQLSRRLESELHIITVVEREPRDPVLKLINLPSDLENRIREKLSEACLAQDPDCAEPSARITVFRGKPSVEILLAIERENPDLVVMGSKGRTGMKRVMLGSVAEKVMQRSPSPVWICRGDGVPLPRKILISTDFSEFSRAALEPAVWLAKMLGADLHLLHVVDLRALYAIDPMLIGKIPDLDARLRNEAEAELSGWVQGIDMPMTATIRLGSPVFEIEEYAMEAGIDLLVMATHGRSGMRHLLIGGVADQVVRYGPCSVMTVCPPAIASRTGPLFESEQQFEEYVKSFRD